MPPNTQELAAKILEYLAAEGEEKSQLEAELRALAERVLMLAELQDEFDALFRRIKDVKEGFAAI